MGDRGNIRMLYKSGKDVYFYSHWGGTDLAETLRRALARNLRHDDESYLARIIFCEMVGDNIRGETGYGISPEIIDNEYPILTVNVEKQTVEWDPNAKYDAGPSDKKTMSFDEFCKADLRNWCTKD